MATKKVKNQSKIISSESTSTTTTITDQCSLWLVIVTGVTILLIVIVGICVRFILEPYLASLILVALICFELVLGIAVLTIIACRRKKYTKASKNAPLRRNGEYYSIQPSAPQETSWEYSNRETLPA